MHKKHIIFYSFYCNSSCDINCLQFRLDHQQEANVCQNIYMILPICKPPLCFFLKTFLFDALVYIVLSSNDELYRLFYLLTYSQQSLLCNTNTTSYHLDLH